MATFLARYLQGEYIQVWNELTALGAGVRQAHVIDSIATAIEGVREWLDEWEDTRAEERPTDDPCVAWIAPDEYHKDDINGGLSAPDTSTQMASGTQHGSITGSI